MFSLKPISKKKKKRGRTKRGRGKYGWSLDFKQCFWLGYKSIRLQELHNSARTELLHTPQDINKDFWALKPWMVQHQAMLGENPTMASLGFCVLMLQTLELRCLSRSMGMPGDGTQLCQSCSVLPYKQGIALLSGCCSELVRNLESASEQIFISPAITLRYWELIP